MTQYYQVLAPALTPAHTLYSQLLLATLVTYSIMLKSPIKLDEDSQYKYLRPLRQRI